MSQVLSASTLLAVPLAPLAGSLFAGILGTAFGGNRVGRAASHTATILGVLIAFVLSALTLNSVIVDGARFDQTLYQWMVIGGLKMEVGFLIDSLTATMMCVVTFVSLMVHIYTIGYMAEDDGYNRFFSYISLFTFSMLMLVMSNNFLQLFFGWEAVGLVSYLLIGFWFNRPTAVFANMTALRADPCSRRWRSRRAALPCCDNLWDGCCNSIPRRKCSTEWKDRARRTRSSGRG